MSGISKMLIANRGEIAVRLIRTAERLGIQTVAVCSEADAHALHVREADAHVVIGPAAARDSYLNIDSLLAAAKQSGVDAVHPGYGFLSESVAFAAACRAQGLTFVGPPTACIAAMGSKIAARAAAVRAGVPILPGTAALADLDAACRAAQDMGYPVLLKAAGGGGGIGMQQVANEAELVTHFAALQDKATRFFAQGAIYLEKLLPRPRHVEVQIAGDDYGNLVHLGERECSIQRRHQKVLEESPSPAVSPALRQRLTDAALNLARQVGYSSLGTVEMLLDGDDFYFLEMNTRLQVEHTVTEMVTGLDLVEWQIRIALGEALPVDQQGIAFAGHAFQCRICAENPDKGFLPAPGRITELILPEGAGVRHDVGVVSGDLVTPFYDSMIAKLVVHGVDRQRALEQLRVALAVYRIDGITTNLGLHKRIAADAAFVAGDLSTQFLKERFGLRV